jgi:hypothetical protein
MNTSPWQTIFTAPRDGTHILCRDCNGTVQVCYPKTFDNLRWEYFRDEGHAPGHSWSMIPTHWMPIPPLTTEAKRPVTPHDLMLTGGSWLGAARTWMQSRFHNGETVTWGSATVLTPPASVEDIEEVAAIAAAAALNDPPRL